MGQLLLATVGIYIPLLVFTLTLVSTSSAERGRRNIPCDHPLRISVPSLFTHCGSACTGHSSWSSWRKVPNSVVSVPVSKCSTRKAYSEERTRTAIGSSCDGLLRETQSICLPSQVDRLILNLGLGSGNTFVPVVAANPNEQYRRKRQSSARCPQYNTHGRVCQHLPGFQKRSTRNKPAKEDVVHTDLDPIPFDWNEHGPRLRNRRQVTCGNETTQHVLFVLDTSGSIGQTNFEHIKNIVALLPPLFCKQVKFAAITFASYVNLEFCFDCFESTYNGRTDVTNAIKNIIYRGGSTRTGAAARCVCNELLDPECGIPTSAKHLDVVFITDGKSNDPALEICDEIRCLHNRFGIDTFAIGINSGSGFTPTYNRAELDCISKNGDLTNVFEFESLTEFENAIRYLIQRLFASASYSCARLTGTICLDNVVS